MPTSAQDDGRSSTVDNMPSPTKVVLTSSAEVQHRPSRPDSSLYLRGLTDGLSRFFTPSDRRGPRVCRDVLRSQPPADPRRHHKSSLKISSSAESKDIAVIASLSASSPLLPSESSPELHSEDNPSTANVVAELEAVKLSEQMMSTLQLPVEKSTLVTEQSKSLTSRQTSVSCGTRMKRSCEQLTDGLSHFFTAVGKRRRRSIAKQYLYSAGRTSVDSSNNFLPDTDDVVSKLPANFGFWMQQSTNTRVATVKLKRLPMKLSWELQKPDNTSIERRTEIYGKTVISYFHVHVQWFKT